MKRSPDIRVALVGCGQIADAHLSQIRRIPWAEAVAVCDVHEDLAYQAAARFGVPGTFTNVERMIESARPDVVHVATPAHTHARLACDLLDAGCHVYVEKPFALNAQEAHEVLRTARHRGRLVCAGHDQLFDPVWLNSRNWIRQGLIGEVRHVDSILGYPIDGKFGALVAANPRHWVRTLPGGLFQNTISHPLYRITDLLDDSQPELFGGWRRRAEFDFPTELSISFQGERQTAELTFSTFLPPQRITRIYGTRGTLDLDFDSQTLRLSRRTRLPSAFAKLEAPWQQLQNSVWNLANNTVRFARGEIHYFDGMKTLFERFYRSVLHAEPLPIPPREIERVTLLMDRIFEHCRRMELQSGATDSLSVEPRACEEAATCP